MSTVSTALSTIDSRRFFDKALSYGVTEGLISAEKLIQIQTDLAKGMVQIANYFGTAYLRPDIELSLIRIVNLISLYLEEISKGDLRLAALSLSKNTLLSHSKAGADMLRKLHAMPQDTLLVSKSGEEAIGYLNQQTAQERISFAKYLEELKQKQQYQQKIDLGFWLAKKLALAANEFCDAESLIQTTMLILLNKDAKLKLPNRAELNKLIKAAKKSSLDTERFNHFFAAAPILIQNTAQSEMARFIAFELPKIKAAQFMPETCYILDADISEISNHDHQLAQNWRKLSHDNDEQCIATLFLLAATELPLKSSLLKREAKELISKYRESGFNPESIRQFIEHIIPVAYQEELTKYWNSDLKNTASYELANDDPERPDFYMERALKYLQSICNASWKGRN
ncbi:hypothetical protein [Iodobacter fluviatilis]|uniref:Uncharacterized protein n=1 Tax=Iodobacter fluviatilis TaxID=537 RepID=A0A377SWF6_9NEIS|nr:hypothetical protein [Iodobacter fluviatilis]TCU88149.1 hypothetical protein EV682_104323 [Iodobacter fluviatilis]STR45650.1 Uncharacterised protein [Iodobacter fluviatilis]